MTGPDEASDERGGERGASRDGAPSVQPLERTAPVYVEAADGYVDIRQPEGDPTLYTPEEARDIARDILAAAEATERGDEGRTDPHGDRG
jgi:predicted dehydrogenase